MKALVTGAAGFIASHLSGQLLDRGAEVIGIDCFADYYPRPIKEANLEPLGSRPGFSFIESTIQGADLDRLLDGVTHVFHLAAQAGVRKSWGHDFKVYTTNNIEATQVLLEACVGKPLHRLVYASSSSVYGDAATIPMREDAVPHPLSPYGVTKLPPSISVICTARITACRPPPCATSPCMVRASARTWRSTAS